MTHMARQLFGVFNSSVVQSSSMPIGTNPMTETWVPVYTVAPDIPLLDGDYIKAFATAEFTNNMGFDVGLVTALTIDTATPPANEPVSAAGQYLTPPAGDDFGTDNLHHKRVVSIGAIILSASLPATAFLSLMAAAQSTAATASSSIAVCPTGYGSMWVEVWR
jgi:hypothetical protein